MFTPDVIRFATDEELAQLDFNTEDSTEPVVQASGALYELAYRVFNLLLKHGISRKVVLTYSDPDDALHIQEPLQTALERITGVQFASQTIEPTEDSKDPQFSHLYIGIRE